MVTECLNLRRIALVRAFLFASFAVFAQPVFADGKHDYEGLWWNEAKDGVFELRLKDNSIEGITRWGEKKQRDIYNPDPALRDRPLKDVVFLWGFAYQEKKNRWKDGKVYDPNTGKTYDAKISLERNGAILKMRGYMGVSFMGRTARFERVNAADLPKIQAAIEQLSTSDGRQMDAAQR